MNKHTKALIEEYVKTHDVTWISGETTLFDERTDVQGYELFVIFDGGADEDFLFRTETPEIFGRLVADDVQREYEADPDTELGWSVEVYQYPRHEGDSPLYTYRNQD